MKITSPKQLAIYLRDLRKTQKISQTDLASRVGIKQDTISKFEQNPDTTKIETFFKILSALNLELHVESKGENKRSQGWTEEW
ncbi:type II toxin-antitoxin system antitoxin HipB [Rouxiella sp. WC2420]|uniref:Type II toxin-antitoxin system antitoxin HipB n=1 Tax=Rouxiella sp. WC2420 TaxID=3234145 RepID=A0AB39VR99_9GAMM